MESPVADSVSVFATYSKLMRSNISVNPVQNTISNERRVDFRCCMKKNVCTTD